MTKLLKLGYGFCREARAQRAAASGRPASYFGGWAAAAIFYDAE